MGNNYFFSESTSLPKQPYLDLLSRGWKPLDMDNYSLPVSSIFNPCQSGETPEIYEFSIRDQGNGVVTATWMTDIAATSQLKYVDTETGIEELTSSDNMLYFYHEVTVSALKPGREYQFQAVSISESYGKALSTPITQILRDF